MRTRDKVKLSVRLIRLSFLLFIFLGMINFFVRGVLPGKVCDLLFLISALGIVVIHYIGIGLSVCPRCGKTNKDRIYPYFRILPIERVIFHGDLPLCKNCLSLDLKEKTRTAYVESPNPYQYEKSYKDNCECNEVKADIETRVEVP